MVRIVKPKPKKSIKYPKGYYDKTGFIKLATNYRTLIFKKIIERARGEGKTFQDMVNEVIEKGLEQSDKPLELQKTGTD